ncbi:caspase 20, apoptosis-related cysteine peptidase [Sinocyclocheilus grahami]|uniref:Caspase-8 n=1 Tax=Sinocyclocheilus grahami TaxID=75366 RepID=A0A672LTY2_SINGR|nr:PREDICTED: caspase-8-like [Sinocyclocheilus grahami]
MDKKESFNRICQNKVFLLETLSVEAEIILQHVQQAEIITKRDYMNLSDVPQREKRVINLLDKLMGKGEEACRRFIELLRQDSILEMFPELKDHAVISSPAMTSPVQEVCQYNIAQIPRGTCVIINNVHFATLKERMGSDVDQKHLEKIFRWLGFEVVAHRNKTAAEMKNLLKDVGKTVDGDCFVCCVLSHGIKEGVCGTDGAVISVDEIREPFNGINCKRLVGKPKMFFIQACRGGKNQDRVQVQADSSEDGESEMEVDGDDFDITIPADTDFLIARSTIDGHLCYRRPEEGSWFIQSLCRNLEQHCPLGTDIQTVLLCVNNEVSNQGFKCKQMPVHEVAMRKKLVLLPP